MFAESKTDMRKFFKWILLSAAAAAILFVVWVFWQRPKPVEMAAFVPSDALVYLEIADLPELLKTLTATAAWRELAPVYGLEADYGNFNSINQFLAASNLGSTDTIVFGRAQIAVALLGTETKTGGAADLQIKPRFAVVIETKSGRAEHFVATRVTEFARAQFGEIRIEKRTTDGAEWTILRATGDERDIFAAVENSTAIIGSDETAVQACLDAKNGRRESLRGSENLTKMRAILESGDAAVFGLMTNAGVKQLSGLGALVAAGNLSDNPAALSALTQSLPPFLENSVVQIGWTLKPNGARVEDRFLIEIPADLTNRLREPLTPNEQNPADLRAAEFLPAVIETASVYHLKNPQTAWRGTLLAMMTRLDMLAAAAFPVVANNLLASYGIKNADEFLGATNGAIMTARLAPDDEDGLAFARTADAAKINNVLIKDDENLSSEFVADAVLLGTKANLTKSQNARQFKQTLAGQPFWQEFANANLSKNPAFLRTLAHDETAAANFVKLFARGDNRAKTVSQSSIPAWAWTTSETRLVREGLERRTVSSFGFVAVLTANFNE